MKDALKEIHGYFNVPWSDIKVLVKTKLHPEWHLSKFKDSRSLLYYLELHPEYIKDYKIRRQNERLCRSK